MEDDRDHFKQHLPYGGKGRAMIIGKDQVVPAGAVRLSRRDVVQIQYNKIKKWKPQSDVWPFNYSGLLLGSSTAVNAVIIHHYFRRKFRLKKAGAFTSLAITVLTPTLLLPVLDHFTVASSIYTISACPTCLEIRSGLIQSTMSVIYPSLISSLLSIYHCRDTGSYLGRDEFHPGLRHAFSSNIRTRNILMLMLASQFGLGFFLTYKRGSCMDFLMAKEAEKVSRREMSADDL